MMRIISGKYRHRQIYYPEDASHIRPTKDRIREAIFSALKDIEGKIVVDLFAGSGAMGLEALSRNAQKVHFVDINQTSIDVIKKNIQKLNIPASDYEIHHNDSYQFLNNHQETIELLFVDPPYQEEKFDDILHTLFEHKLLGENGIIVFETDRKREFSLPEFQKIKEYKYGKIYVYIFWR